MGHAHQSLRTYLFLATHKASVEPQQKMWNRNAVSEEIHKWVPHRLASEAHWSRAANEEGLAWAKQNSKTSLEVWPEVRASCTGLSSPHSSLEPESVPATLIEKLPLRTGHSAIGSWPLIFLHSPCMSSDPISQRFLVKRRKCLISPGNETNLEGHREGLSVTEKS